MRFAVLCSGLQILISLLVYQYKPDHRGIRACSQHEIMKDLIV